jgi:hypothetical protein
LDQGQKSEIASSYARDGRHVLMQSLRFATTKAAHEPY